MKAIVCGKEVELPAPGDLLGIFNYVKNHLLTQNEKSIRHYATTNNDLCVYRNNNNTKACAAGCLIPDDKYDPSFESKNSFFISTLNYLDGSKPSPVKNLIRRLQHIHDNSKVEEWPAKLDNLYKELFENSPSSP